MTEAKRKLAGLFFLLLGSCLFWYPVAIKWYGRQETIRYIEAFEQEYPLQENVGKDMDYTQDSLYRCMLQYNQQLYHTGQETFADPWSVAQIPAVYGLEEYRDKAFGYIQIPAMDTVLPLYIGASVPHMARGAVVLGETSLPVGGENSNCVVAGHRGYRGAAFFRDIQKLQAGDCVQIRNPWEELTYRVEAVRCIAPDDSEAVKIQKGRDMLTLLTCHPYRGHGKERYVVYCVRMTDGGEEETVKTAGEVVGTAYTERRTAGPTVERENLVRYISGAAIAAMCLYTLKKRTGNKKRRKKREENR